MVTHPQTPFAQKVRGIETIWPKSFSDRVHGAVDVMTTLGVDLAASPEETTCCTVEWHRATAEIVELQRRATDDDLLKVFGRAAKIGIDTPFGWPVEFVRAVGKYENRNSEVTPRPAGP